MKSMLKIQLFCRKGRKKRDFVGIKRYFGGLIAAVGSLPLVLTAIKPALAAPAASCAGAVMMGAAALMCNDSAPDQPAQICSYSWALMTAEGVTKVVDGSFLIAPGTANMQVYSANGYSTQLTGPIVMCHDSAAKPKASTSTDGNSN
jgi:hypothetical protein